MPVAVIGPTEPAPRIRQLSGEQAEKLVLAEIAFDLQNGSQFACRDASHQIDDRRLEPSLMAYAEDDSARSQACTTRSASASVRHSGFSQKTCLPRSAAEMACSA